MKKLLFLFGLICTNICIAQTTYYGFDKKNGSLYFSLPPVIFIDSVKVNFEMLRGIQPNDILNVQVVKTPETYTTNNSGKIYYTLKKGVFYIFYDYVNFKKKYISITDKPILLLLNSNIIHDYSGFMVAENNILKVEINEGADIAPLKKMYPNYTLVNILTKDVFNPSSISNIMLQGLPTNAVPL